MATEDIAAAEVAQPVPEPVTIDPKPEPVDVDPEAEARAAVLAAPAVMLAVPVTRGPIDRLVWERKPRGFDGDEVSGVIAIADSVGNVVARVGISVVDNGDCVGLTFHPEMGARPIGRTLKGALTELKAAVDGAKDRDAATFAYLQTVGLLPTGR